MASATRARSWASALESSPRRIMASRSASQMSISTMWRTPRRRRARRRDSRVAPWAAGASRPASASAGGGGGRFGRLRRWPFPATRPPAAALPAGPGSRPRAHVHRLWRGRCGRFQAAPARDASAVRARPRCRRSSRCLHATDRRCRRFRSCRPELKFYDQRADRGRGSGARRIRRSFDGAAVPVNIRLGGICVVFTVGCGCGCARSRP